MRRLVSGRAAPVKAPRAASWRNYGVLFNRTYRSRTILAATIGAASSFGYNAIIFGLPVIITSFFHQGPLTTIIAALTRQTLRSSTYQPAWSATSWAKSRPTQAPPGSCGTAGPTSLTFARARPRAR